EMSFPASCVVLSGTPRCPGSGAEGFRCAANGMTGCWKVHLGMLERAFHRAGKVDTGCWKGGHACLQGGYLDGSASTQGKHGKALPMTIVGRRSRRAAGLGVAAATASLPAFAAAHPKAEPDWAALRSKLSGQLFLPAD